VRNGAATSDRADGWAGRGRGPVFTPTDLVFGGARPGSRGGDPASLRRSVATVDSFPINLATRWLKANSGIQPLCTVILRMDVKLDRAAAGVVRMDVAAEYVQGLVPVALALPARVDEKMEDPVVPAALRFIRQRDEAGPLYARGQSASCLNARPEG